MRFTCTQENLFQGLSLVGHIAGKSANLPILSHVLLKTDGGGLKLAATNLEMAVSALVRGRVEEPGEFTVPAKLLMDYVALLPSGKVELAVVGDQLEVKADDKTTSVKGLPASEFPTLPRLAQDGGFRLSSQDLARAIGQAAFAVSASDSRPELGGVACFFSNTDSRGFLTLAATDSYRLTERVTPLKEAVSSEMKCIVPGRSIQELGRVLASYQDEMATPEEVQWFMSDSQLVAVYGTVELISRLIEASFPDYKQIIPAQFRTTCKINLREFAKAVKAAALFSRQGIFGVELAIEPGRGLTVSASDTGTGSHTTTLKAEIRGEPNKVTVNYRYMTDGLSAMAGEEAVIRLIDGANPVVVTPAVEDGFRYVVMPIRQ